MKLIKTFILTLIILSFAFVGCGKEEIIINEGINFNLKLNETYQIQIAKSTKSYEIIDGKFVNLINNFKTGYKFQVKEIKDDGTFVLTGSIANLLINYEGPLGNVNFNSTNDQIELSILEKPYLNLLNKDFELIVKKTGEVISVSGMTEIIQETYKALNVSEAFIKESFRDLLNSNFSNEILSETFGRMFYFYPNKVVNTGEKWTNSFKLNQTLPLIANSEFELLERNNGVAVIKVDSKIETDTFNVKNSKYLLEGKHNGKIMLDEITGWVSKANFHYELHAVSKNDADSTSTVNKLLSSEMHVKYEPFDQSTFKDIKFEPQAIIKGDGISMMITGMSVVFSSLVLIYLLFNYIGIKLNKKPKVVVTETENVKEVNEQELTGEINAAIAAAIYFYSQELHDTENTVLTISKISRTYSPWSSKIYGLRQIPR